MCSGPGVPRGYEGERARGKQLNGEQSDNVSILMTKLTIEHISDFFIFTMTHITLEKSGKWGRVGLEFVIRGKHINNTIFFVHNIPQFDCWAVFRS